MFHSLTTEDVKQIVDLLMRRVEEQLKIKDVDIELTDAAKTLLAEQGWDQALGARPLRRTIQRLVEDPLAEKLLHKEYRAGEIDPRRRGRRRDRLHVDRRDAAARRATRGARGLARVGRTRVPPPPGGIKAEGRGCERPGPRASGVRSSALSHPAGCAW